MKIRNTITLIIIILVSLSCRSQQKEDYWKLTKIYREDKTAFKGLMVNAMQQMLDYNFHFIRKGDSLYFELPTKFTVDIHDLNSFSQLHITDKEYFEMYDHAFNKDTFIIKFKDNATMSDSKNTIMAFNRIPKEAFEKDIQAVIEQQKEMSAKIIGLQKQLEANPQITLHQVVKLPQKKEVIQDDKGNNITLQIPQEIDVKKSGAIKTEEFGAIKIGTFVDKSRIYDVVHPQKNYRLKQLAIWLSTASADFDLAKYTSENPRRVIYKEHDNSICGYELDYDPENKKAIIGSVFCLKYYKVGQTHVFIYADVYRSQFKGNFDPMVEMNEILNFNYQLSENITLK